MSDSGTDSFRCSKCDKSFDNKKSLIKHRNRKKNGKVICCVARKKNNEKQAPKVASDILIDISPVSLSSPEGSVDFELHGEEIWALEENRLNLGNDHQIYKLKRIHQKSVAKSEVTDSYLQGTANATSKDIQNTEEYKCRPIEKDILKCMLKKISKNDKILGIMVVTADLIELKGDNVYKCPVSCF